MKATFFVLAWLAQRMPHLAREIAARGHEVASHGCNHELPDKMLEQDLRKDLTDSRKFLEDITGSPVSGYRAPSFAINDQVLKITAESGYRYDSSYNSFGLHGRYGRISLNGNPRHGIAHRISENFYELPISNLHLRAATASNLQPPASNLQPTSYPLPPTSSKRNVRFVLPLGGGGYFRIMPSRLFRLGVRWLLRADKAFVFYMHPWEIDAGQPKVETAAWGYRFRHYTNLSRTYGRLGGLIRSLGSCRFVTCGEYLNTA